METATIDTININTDTINIKTDTINIQCPRIFDSGKNITFTLLDPTPNITKHVKMGEISDFLPNP